jgi:hypothetical protein
VKNPVYFFQTYWSFHAHITTLRSPGICGDKRITGEWGRVAFSLSDNPLSAYVDSEVSEGVSHN